MAVELNLPLILLASKSPRRKMLLEAAGFPVEVVEIKCEEKYPPDLPLEKVAEYIAALKADAANHYCSSSAFVLTADTIVVCDQEVLEKPSDPAEAKEMLNKLAGNVHQVFTGVVISSERESFAFSDKTIVELSNLSTAEINFYISQFQPFDKAGSYGIQDWIGWTKIRKVEGSYANVMGLPVDLVYEYVMGSTSK